MMKSSPLKSSSTASTTNSISNSDDRDSVNINRIRNPKQSLWWQQSVVRRSQSAINRGVEDAVENSTFLQQEQPSQEIAVFSRSEIRTGNLLGEGGFSAVYEVVAFDLDPSVSDQCTSEQQLLREKYAANCVVDGTPLYCIKHLKQRLLLSPTDFQRASCDLVLEAEYMSRLDHPNILRLHGLPKDGLSAFRDGSHDDFFIITEHLPSTLDQQIQEWKTTGKSPSVEEKAALALQLAEALSYLHSLRIVFRDIKPANIGLDQAGMVKLFDFGLCREIPTGDCDEVFEMSGVGTRRYMAIEIINSGRYNCKADVYSFAMVFWELLTHHRPFAGHNIQQHRITVCQGGERPRLRFDWPAWLHRLLRECWRESMYLRLSMDQVVSRLSTATQQAPPEISSVLDSPVCVRDFVIQPDLSVCMPLPKLMPSSPTVSRRLSLNPQLLSPSVDDDIESSSGLFDSSLDCSLLGLTICLDDGIEVCAKQDTATLTSSRRPPFPERRKSAPYCTV